MSTILKALRRLEEDDLTRTAGPTDSLPASDSRAVDELRDRILDEESAAQAITAAAPGAADPRKRLVMAAVATLLILGLGVGVYTMSISEDSESPAIVATETPASVSAPSVDEPRAGETLVRVKPSPNDQVFGSPARRQAAPSNSATAQGSNRQAPLAGAEATETPSEEASLAALAESQPSIVPIPVPVPVQSATTTSAAPSAVSPSSSPSTTTPPAAPSAATKSVAQSAPTPSRSEPADEMALAAVTPTSATLAANSPRRIARSKTPSAEALAASKPPRSRSEPTGAAPSPPSVSAPQPATAPRTKLAESRPKQELPPEQDLQPKQSRQRKQESQAVPEPSQVERLDRRGLPDLTVLRTAWHPKADRRSAKIRLETTDEIMTLREGDAVGGLVIQKISPSSVLFKAGDIEVRRRVGHPGSGG